MAKSFSKKIEGKIVTVYPADYDYKDKILWGVQTLCPWCGKDLVSTGASTPKKAAELIFGYVVTHWKATHKTKK